MLGLTHLFDRADDVAPAVPEQRSQTSSPSWSDREMGGEPPLVLS